MKTIQLWVSREMSGYHMVTMLKPEKHKVGLLDREEWFVPHGDPLSVRHICAFGIKMFLDVELEPGTQKMIEFTRP